MITGASSGIGRAIAERFASEGANVAICSRSAEDVERVAADINDRTDEAAGGEDDEHESDGRGRAIALECDVTDREEVETFVEGVVEEFGTIDCLVNNAGASFMSSFDDISRNGWERSLTPTCMEPIAACRPPVPTSGKAVRKAKTRTAERAIVMGPTVNGPGAAKR